MGASLGTGNRGVSALGASLVTLVEEALPGAEPFMLIGNRESQPFELRINGVKKVVPVVNYRMSPGAGFRKHLLCILLAALVYRCCPIRFVRRAIVNAIPWVKAVVEAKVVGEIRGGDSFSDIYGLRRFVMGSLPVLSVILLRGRVVLLPQTYGPYRSAAARWLARWILRRAELILSRDRESMGVVERLIGKTERCVFCPDVAFALEPISPEVVKISPMLPATRPGVLVGINVSGLMYWGGYTRDNMFGLKLDYRRFLVELLQQVLADPKTRVLLVPHTFAPAGSVESDPAACREVRQAMPPQLQSRLHMVEGEYDQNEIKAIIGMCDFFIGSRMHACIAALSQNIPAVGVAYSKKFRGVFETVGAAGSVIDGREVDVAEATCKAMELYAARDSTRANLQTRVQEARSRLHAIFRELGTPEWNTPSTLHQPALQSSECV
jgi:colanic acid/amylovoran biosynthesis protein